ncbi:MAG: cation diffusion facilitator family transporter [Ignisphaera sp.]|uniref:Cation diffusion facilitator family transporter n=1 Tax=Ignisphaera aggregans TaxID=334771 RepID=A0A7J3MWC4_9CREN
MHVVYISFSVNLATLTFKILGFIDTHSISLFADVLNDLGDCIGLGFLIFGLILSKKKRSSIAYPFGMSRALYVFSLISISIIGGFLFSISFIKSIEVLLHDGILSSSSKAIVFALIALILNSFNMMISIASKNDFDPVTTGTFVDSMVDFFGSIIAFTSVVTANNFVDGIGGVIVSIILLISSIVLGYRYFLVLIGRAPPKEELLKILNTVLFIPNVADVNELKAIMLTENEYLVVLEVEINENIEVEDLETVSKIVENEIRKAIHKVKHVVVEFVSRKREPPTYRRIIEEINKLKE